MNFSWKQKDFAKERRMRFLLSDTPPGSNMKLRVGLKSISY